MAVPLSKTAQLIVGATPSLRRRIYAKIVRPSRRACWRWTGATARKRDGAKRPQVRVGGRGSRVIVVARVLLSLRDRIPLIDRYGLEAGHTCHHYWCVNPRHLEWQTRVQNEEAKQEFDDYCDFAQAVDDLASEAAA
jgi:hypothetical protein